MPSAADILRHLLEDDSNGPDSVESDIKALLSGGNEPAYFATLYQAVVAGLIDVSGTVYRHSHYYHEKSTTFSLHTSWTYDERVGTLSDEDSNAIEQAANQVQNHIKDEIIDINQKIYSALEKEYNYQFSDESLSALGAVYLENGELSEDDEGVTFDQLSDRAKDHARSKYGGVLDSHWSEHILDEWKAELEDMGFGRVVISFSGFYSQGDGASFTAESFDFEAYWNWFYGSHKSTEAGRPYTDGTYTA